MRNIFSRDYVKLSGSILPASSLRWCGAGLKEDTAYLESAINEAKRLIEKCNCNENSTIVDVGCGQGRLPIGLLRFFKNIKYTGFDVDKRSIQWCNKHIASKSKTFSFNHLNLGNERYNPEGAPLNNGFNFPVSDNSIDIIYLFSVFSHMTKEDVIIYLQEFIRMIKSDGKIFFTAFVENDVPEYSINPDGYIFKHCSGPLHIVRFEKDYLFSLLGNVGFQVDMFTHRSEIDSQSGIYCSVKKNPLQ
jgi:ubiquinone/menaquinone biosynthesis C-methylase UbiE